MTNIELLLVTSSDINTPNAPNSRYLLIAKGLATQGVKVKMILLHGIKPCSSVLKGGEGLITFHNCIVSERRSYRKKSFIRLLHQYVSILSLYKVIGSTSNNAIAKACYFDGRKLLLTFISIMICKVRGTKAFYFRAEHPLLCDKKFYSTALYEHLWNKIVISQMDHIFVISTALKNYYVQLTEKMNRSIPISIVNMMIDPKEVESSSVNQYNANGNMDIVYVGTMYGQKDGVYDLVSAYSLIMHNFPLSRLVLVGDNTRKSLMRKVIEAVEHAQDPSRVIMTGILPKEKVYEVINSAYCLVLARPDSLQGQYGFPNKLGEYLATGRPVVITSVGDICLFLKNRVHAYISEPGNVNAFAQNLGDCLDDPVCASKIGKKGKELTYEIFYYKNAVKPILSALTSYKKL